MYRTLITPDQLVPHLGGAWTIIDCRFDLGAEQAGHESYRTNHVPGAVYASLSLDLSGGMTGTNGRHPIPTPDQMRQTFARLGISNGRQVVAYDQDAGAYAARLWWMLTYMGHDAVAVLDGGWARWTQEGRPVETGDVRPQPGIFLGNPRTEMLVGVDAVVPLQTSGCLLVDARAAERFEGRTEPLDRVAGHIPGAVNHPYRDNVTDAGTMRDERAVRRSWEATLAGRAPSQVVMYCGSGVTACHNLLAMAHAGLPGGRLYAGSWSEWSSDPSRPVETGPAGA